MRVMLATVALAVVLPGVADADDCFVCNAYNYCVCSDGLDCSNPGNVIDDLTYQYAAVFVRNVGCPPDWPAGNPWDSCPSPGDPTEVCVVDGADVDVLGVYDSSTVTMSGGIVGDIEEDSIIANDSSTVRISGGTVRDPLYAYDSSAVTISGGWLSGVESFDSSTVTIDGGEVMSVWVWSKSLTMSGGTVGNLAPRGSSIVTISGGTVVDDLDAWHFPTVTMTGGTVGDRLLARYSSTITIAGCDFAVDGTPVPYGDLTAQTGTLTGKLASGDPINNVYYQGGWTEYPCSPDSPCTGTITLVEGRLFPALSSWGKLALGASLLGVGSLGVGAMRRRAG